ncbi:PREDICTED: LOW QUALITY PROTEIN: inactive serine/threonine-protein kinase PLK5 [Mandrillus leucophaeus]|uniref:LOW QUALITY PROTEIN: inactive serine/threonine-protein kinase PLK5 n=1 Tax=Mandrillus leucophaeus TaxID=9568 RepID=UPI0005F56A95|nr:PREDICTED: LOW QUALITY PROTEIN: inactive serine/threonine-protein kinase PLK5 [Mandrillus leucophaeus]
MHQAWMCLCLCAFLCVQVGGWVLCIVFSPVCVCVKRLGHTCVPGCPVPLSMLPACTPVRTCPLIRWPSPQGAFSRCYKLTDMSTSAVFALKVVPRGGAGPGCLRTQGKVDREIALHSRLRHRNIVAFHGHFADRDHVYMVLEYCSRQVPLQSLAHVLRARQTLTEPEVRYYLRGLVSGLHYLHQRHIVHRDLKLSNFFLNKNMEVKIGDLGLAAKVGPGGRCHGVLCGTPNFLAPEVVSRNGHSCQSDIWALGCIMYTVLTGAPPFMASPLSEMYQNIREGHYPEPAHLSANARRLIARLLAPNPAERPSLDHLLQDDFFTQGFTPDRLPAHSCHSPPIFAVPPPLGKIFRKVGQLLLTQCRPPSYVCLRLATQDPLGEQRLILWAPKWVDHSSKYGFGYQLSDGGWCPASGRHPHGPASPRRMSFSGVPAQLVLSGEGEGLQLTLWEQGPPGTSYSLDILRSHGCAPATQQRLHHAVRMLQSI